MEDDTEHADENILGLVDKKTNNPNSKQVTFSGEPSGLIELHATDSQDTRQQHANVNMNSTTDRFGNQMTHAKRQILNWKGDIVQEQLQISQVSDKELIEMIEMDFARRQEKQAQEQAEANGEQVNIAADQLDLLRSPSDYLTELKDNWPVEFIEKQGFDYLLTIMKTIVGKYVDA